MKISNILQSRRFKHGSMATIVTVIFIVAVVIINIIAGLILDRFPANVDLTENKIFELREDSINFVKDITDTVTITVCAKEDDLLNLGTIGKQANEILQNYAKYNSNIKINYVDLLEEPEFASNYPNYEIATGSVVVETDKRTKVVTVNDFVDAQSNSQTGQTTYRSKAEQVMTGAIMYVTDQQVSKVSVINNHAGTEIPLLTAALEENNYEILSQNLMTEEIDSETTAVAIFTPSTDFTDDELKKLDTFLDNNGNFGKTVIYVPSPNHPDLPNLTSFLEEWGVSVGDGFIAETDDRNVYLNSRFAFSADYTTDDTTAEITSNLNQPELPFMVYQARPLSTIFTESGNRSAKLLVASPDSTIIYPLVSEGDPEVDVNALEQQSVGVVALGQRIKYLDNTPLRSNVLVFAGPEIFNQEISIYVPNNNTEFAVNTLNHLAGKEDAINLSSVSFSNQTLTVTQSQYNFIFTFFVILLPLAMVVCGIIVWIRRRNK